MSKNANLVFSYANEHADINGADKTKVIRMSLGGFCIAVVSPQNRIDKLLHYACSSDLSWKERLKIIAAFEKEEASCSKNIFRLYTEYNTQIPEEFYTTDDENAISALLTDRADNYIAISEKIEDWKLYNVSLCDKTRAKEIKEYLPAFQLSTTLSSLMKIAAKQQQETGFVFIENNHFVILVGNKDHLLGVNTFPFASETDFLYYCLSFLRKISPKINDIPLVLCGNIAEQSPLFTAVEKYFPSVKLITAENESNFPTENYSYYCDLFVK
jgi:hypothetical protein